jgi:hypothetical protein
VQVDFCGTIATFLRSNRNVTIDMKTKMMRRGLMNWVEVGSETMLHEEKSGSCQLPTQPACLLDEYHNQQHITTTTIIILDPSNNQRRISPLCTLLDSHRFRVQPSLSAPPRSLARLVRLHQK